MKIVYLCVLVFTILSCRNEGELSKELLVLRSHPIVLPQGEDLIIHNPNSIFCNGENKLKYIIYSDSLNCSSCMINNLVLWNPIINYCKNYEGNIVFYFVFSPAKKDLRSLNMLIKNSEFKYPIIVDGKKNFAKLNSHLPKHNLLHTFLLDENNNVILVGNPVYNKKIKDMFYRIVEERFGKPERSVVENN